FASCWNNKGLMDQLVARLLRHQLLMSLVLGLGLRFVRLPRSGFVLCLLVASATRLAAVSGDENWDDRFLPPGGGAFSPLAADGTNVYAGGAFSFTNGVQN